MEGYGIAPSGYRLPDATRLGRVRLRVADLDRSVAYYRDVVGLQALERSKGAAELRAVADGPVLVELVERQGAAAAPSRGRLGLYHFAILLPDRTSLARFTQHLHSRGDRFGASDHHVSEALYISDPDGLGIEVYADRPRDAWERRGEELRMETAPLDYPSLLAAAGDAPWQGLPAGTRIGHIHLHVGDIAAAERFYHRALGFDRIVWSYPGALFMAAGGYHHHLGVNSWAGSSARPAGENDAALIDWEIRLPTANDADAARRSLEDAGIEVHRADDGWWTADPWGTRVEVTGDR